MSAIAGIVGTGNPKERRSSLEAMAATLSCPARGAPSYRFVEDGAFAFLPGPGHLEGAPGIVETDRGLTVADAWLAEVDGLPPRGAALPAPPRSEPGDGPSDGSSPGSSDEGPAATLARAFATWGEAEGARRAYGSWAAACWNPRAAELLLLRDHRGFRPLFWARGPWGIAFATEMKALFALPGLERRGRAAGIVQFLSGMLFEGEGSLWEGVHRAPPASCLRLRPDGREIQRYWHPESIRVLDGLDADLEEEGRSLIRRIVHQSLPPSGTAGILLSGGLDSSLLAALAAPEMKSRRGRLVALSSRLPPGHVGPERDEGALIDLMVETLGIEGIAVDRKGANPFAELHAVLDALDEPGRIGLYAGLSQEMATRARKAGAGILLTGEGGDEALSFRATKRIVRLLFQGEPRLYRDALSAEALRSGTSLGRSFLRSLLGPLRARLGRWLAPPKGPGRSPLDDGMDCLAAEVFREPELVRALAELDEALALPLGYDDALHVCDRSLVGLNAQFYDGSFLFHEHQGLAMRCPLADPRVLDYVRRLPDRMFFLPELGLGRGLIRRLARSLLPEPLRLRRDKGSFAPAFRRRISASAPDMAQALQRWRRSHLGAGLVDLDRLEAYLHAIGPGEREDPFDPRGLAVMATVMVLLCLEGERGDP